MTLAELIPVLQTAVGPVVLVSGVGLLIISLTNRLGRVVDRGRNLASDLREIPKGKHPSIDVQLQILSRRAHLLRRSIVYSVLCVLFAAVLIIVLFLTAAFGIESAWLVGSLLVLFVCTLGSLVLSLIDFLRELNQALIAFHMDIEQ